MGKDGKGIVLFPPPAGKDGEEGPLGAGVGVAAIFEDGRVIATGFFHEEEPATDVILRTAAKAGIAETPDMVAADDVHPAITLAVERMILDEEFAEDGQDFLINYSYSVSEGVPLPDLDKADESPAPRAPAQTAEPSAAQGQAPFFAVPLTRTRVVEGVTVRRSVSGDLSIDLPLLTKVESVEIGDILVVPGTETIMIPSTEWQSTPGTIIIPAEAGIVMRLGQIPAPLDLMVIPGWVVVKNPVPIHIPVRDPTMVDVIEDADDARSVAPPIKSRMGKLSGRVVFWAAVAAASAVAVLLSMREPEDVVPGDAVGQIRQQVFAPGG